MKFTAADPGYLCALLLPALLALSGTNAQSCQTPQNRNGLCINIRECQPIIDILRRRPLSNDAVDFIRNSQCGFEGPNPKVCCESGRDTAVQALPTSGTTADPQVENTSQPDVSNHPNLGLLPHDVCGPVTAQKIFGGERTGIFEFPWMALIAYNTDEGLVYLCGGSIIHRRYVLTAAHCVTSLPSRFTVTGVRVGEHDISRERDCDRDASGLEVVCAERYQDFGIESVHYHSGYVNGQYKNDIALLRLNGNIDFRPQSVRPICLPVGTARTLTQKKVVVTGWGTTELGRGSDVLLKVLLSPVPLAQCAIAYSGKVDIWHKQTCAGGTKSMDSCKGDSGGPLQAPGIYNNHVRYVQYGLVSFGPKSCGTEGLPGVYTNITYYTDWILDTIRP